MTSLLTRKPNSRSIIANLSEEQRDQLESWMFDENLAYKTAVNRCMEKFKVKIHYRAVLAFYHETSKKRALQRIITNSRTSDAVNKMFDKHPAKTYESILKLIAQIAFNKVTETGDQVDVKTIRDLTSLLITARRDDIRAQRFALEREKWEFDCVHMVQAHFNDLEEITRDKSLDEDARLLAIQHRLFGAKLPV